MSGHSNITSYWSSGNLIFAPNNTSIHVANIQYQGEIRQLWGVSTSSRNAYSTAVDVIQLFTNCTATSGICTGLDYEHAAGYQGSTSLQFTGIRGVLRVLTGTTHTSGYNDAAAGYIKMEGTINGDGHYYGVRGVVLDGGTWTACTEVAAGCFEYNNAQTVSSGLTAVLLLKNNSSPGVAIDSLFYVYQGAGMTYAFNFAQDSVAPIVAADITSGKACTHGITIKVANTVLKIPCYAV